MNRLGAAWDRLKDRELASGDSQHAVRLPVLHPLPCSDHSKLTCALSASHSKKPVPGGRVHSSAGVTALSAALSTVPDPSQGLRNK